MSRSLRWSTADERAAGSAGVAAHLRDGGLIVYPTETVYGFGCALRPDALAVLAALKDRSPDRPFLLLVRGPADLPELRWTDAARALAEAFWPGPLTLALAAPSDAFPPEVLGPGGTVAIRASPHPGVRALLAALGEPVTSTSANPPGDVAAADADAARSALARAAAAAGAGPPPRAGSAAAPGRPAPHAPSARADGGDGRPAARLRAAIAEAADRALVLDGGVLPPSSPSTVLDCSAERPRLVRTGAVPLQRLLAITEIDV